MNKIFKNALIVCLSLLLLPACESEELGNIALTEEEEVNLISFKLKYTVADMVAGTAESKALTRSDVDADGIYSNIENVMVVQFDGADETSTVSRIDYITNLLDPEIMLVETNVRTIVLFLANIFDENCVSVGQTLAEVKTLGITMSGNITETVNGIIYDESLVRANAEGRLHFMSSDCKIYEYGIQSGEDIEINLQRNVSRIKLNISNGWEGQILKSVDIAGIPTTYLYYANRSTEIETPIVPETVGNTTSYTQTIGTEGGTEENPEVTELTFYVPVNMRGYDENSTAETKPESDCASGATYAKITFSYRTDMTSEDYGSAIFKLYLGSDLEKDFNLKPNTYYAYDITFTGTSIDNVEQDARISVVEPIDGVNYTNLKSSNCYILNPYEYGEITYYIPISTRINEYWGSIDYGNNSDYCISAGDVESWEYAVLWYDNDTDPVEDDTEVTLTSKKLNIEKVEVNDISALKITLGEDFDNMGNILVAVKNSSGTILWSWHFWITDYNPYEHGFNATDAGVYTLTNGTGAVHRYQDRSDFSVWSTGGIYENKYMMDRIIGARSAASGGTIDYKSVLFYQFGRKDPFHTPVSVGSGPTIMNNSVFNPTTYYLNDYSNWCNSSAFTNSTYGWHDPSSSAYDAEASNYGRKSIFDPSPYGWRLPVYEVWSNFYPTTYTYDNMYKQNLSKPSSLTAYTDGYAYYYTYNNSKIYYTRYGRIDGKGGSLTNSGSDVFYCSITPQKDDTERQFVLFSTGNYAGRATGGTAICIED